MWKDVNMQLLATLLLVFCHSYGVYSRCPTGWIRYRGSCYGFSNDSLSWASSQAICAGFGGHLAVFDTKREGEYLIDLARSKEGLRNWWIGATDVMREDNFTWITTGKRINSYGKWAHYSLDDDPGDENCVVIKGYYDYKWYEQSCYKGSNFICEKVEVR